MPSPLYRSLAPDASVDNTNQGLLIGEKDVAYFQLHNPGTVDAYFQLYDALTADVTVGSTTPRYTFLVPAGVGATQVGAYEYTGPPLHFEKGVVYAATVEFAGGTNPTTKPTLGAFLYR